MHSYSRRAGFLKAALLILVLSSFSLSCVRQPHEGKAAIVVNNYTMTQAEFNELFKESGMFDNTPEARKSFLDNMITRKLILQEAQKEGLDKDKDFLQSVEHFWEQSLLKVMIDKKISEIAPSITVSEQEIVDYYNQWVQKTPNNQKTLDELRDPIRQQLMKIKQTDIINTWIEGLKRSAKIKVDKKAVEIE